ncbi:S-layer homology domain-containing protein [Cohnella hongkongensis]|uniref:S-layer homology domain-containing protein n=1 Tax=Cohnella hongkongensis TaxID=178337 RepID=A0ABV9FA76_9BACL
MPTAESLRDVVYANGIFMAVGTGGTLMTSEDGIEWQSQSSGTSKFLTGIARSDDLWVAVGEGGTILASEDGSAWTVRASGVANNLNGVVYSGSRFVAVGDGGAIVHSADGEIWTKVQNPPSTNNLTGVTYSPGAGFVAVGPQGTVWGSSNGSDWTLQNSGVAPNLSITDVVYGDAGFTAVGFSGTILASVDGTNWTSQSPPLVRHYYGVNYVDGGLFITGGNASIVDSPDGESWTGQLLDLPNKGQISLRAAAYGNGVYVAVGDWGTIVTSADGANWVQRNRGTGYMLSDVAYHDGIYVSVGLNGVILTSADGEEWIHRSSDGGQSLNGVVYGDGIFMAVGYRGTMVVSSDGETFDVHTVQVPNVDNINNVTLLDVAYGDGVFVVGGGLVGGADLILVSRDKGASWTQHSLGVANYNRGAAFGNGTFIVTGTLAMGVSKDGGSTWTKLESMKDYYDVVYANGVFVAVGGQGQIATSSDGLTWQLHPQPSTAYFRGGVTYADNTFLAVGAEYELEGNYVVGYEALIATSSDGVNWSLRSAGIDKELLRVVHGDSGFVAVGRDGTILQSVSAAAPVDLNAVGIDVAAGLLTGTTAGMEYSLDSTDGTDGTWLSASPGSTSVVFGPSQGVYVRESTNPSNVRQVGSIPAQAAAPSVGADLSGGLSAVKLSGATAAMEYSMDGGATWQAVTSGLAGGAETIDASAPSADLRVRIAATASLLPSQMTDKLNSLTLAIISHPADTSGAPGGSATFSVQATGMNLTYQWEFDALGNGTFINMPMSTSPTLTLVNLTEQQNGQRFRVVVTGHGGSVTSNAATLTVSAQPGAWTVQATRGNGEVRLDWEAITGAIEYDVYQAPGPGQYGAQPEATVTSSTYTVTGLTNGHPYYFKVQAKDASGLLLAESAEAQATPATVPGAPAGVSATAGNGSATVSFTAPTDTGGSPIIGYEVTAMPGNMKATGAGSPITVTGLTNGTSYTFTVKAINAVDKSEASAVSNAVTPTAPPSGNNGGSDNGSGSPSQPAETSPAKPEGVEVLVNGKAENAGTITTVETGGRRVTTVAVDEDKLQERLEAEGNRAVITIPVNADSETVVGELNGRMVKNMEARQAVIELRTEQASYTLPALQINMDDLAKRFGANPELQDIKIRIEIAVPSAEWLQIASASASEQGLTILAPPLEFSVQAVYGGKSEEVATFNAYVQRTLAIPDGVDPSRITTGVVIDPDGTVRHVPTKIIVKDGKYYAQINSLTNSAYSVVWHPLEFQDAAAHWAKDAINDMGSRMVVNGTGAGMFSPDRDVTRAEFAAILVRGLGLKPSSAAGRFLDVNASEWYDGAIGTAYAYGLLNGYEDGTFRPNENLTREQAMRMLSKAIALTGLQANESGLSAEKRLQTFKDVGDISNWALEGAASSVSAGVFSGRSGESLAPKANLTRAEVATIMQRLLQKSDLINK